MKRKSSFFHSIHTESSRTDATIPDKFSKEGARFRLPSYATLRTILTQVSSSDETKLSDSIQIRLNTKELNFTQNLLSMVILITLSIPVLQHFPIDLDKEEIIAVPRKQCIQALNIMSKQDSIGVSWWIVVQEECIYLEAFSDGKLIQDARIQRNTISDTESMESFEDVADTYWCTKRPASDFILKLCLESPSTIWIHLTSQDEKAADRTTKPTICHLRSRNDEFGESSGFLYLSEPISKPFHCVLAVKAIVVYFLKIMKCFGSSLVEFGLSEMEHGSALIVKGNLSEHQERFIMLLMPTKEGEDALTHGDSILS